MRHFYSGYIEANPSSTSTPVCFCPALPPCLPTRACRRLSCALQTRPCAILWAQGHDLGLHHDLRLEMRSVMCGMDSLGLSASNTVDARARAMRTRWGQFGIGAFRYFSGPVWSQKLILGSLGFLNQVSFTPHSHFWPRSSSQNHHTAPYRSSKFSLSVFCVDSEGWPIMTI